jgi:hypothetical protein
VSSIYRDRLAQISGRSARDILTEVKLRTNIIKVLLERDITNIKDISNFCRKYAANSQAAIESLGLNRDKLL